MCIRDSAVANLASGLFGGMIAAGSMSASAVKEAAGARSQVANLVTWLATIVTVLFLTPLFKNLPEAVLGALIIHAVWHIIASRKLRRIHLESRTEFWLGVLTFAGVILIDVLQGMLLGLICSLLFFIYKSIPPTSPSSSWPLAWPRWDCGRCANGRPSGGSAPAAGRAAPSGCCLGLAFCCSRPVSYTHLTLPPNREG